MKFQPLMAQSYAVQLLTLVGLHTERLKESEIFAPLTCLLLEVPVLLTL